MSKVIVMFEDESQAKVVGFFGSPQNPDDYPNMGEVEEDDQRYLDYLARQSGYMEPVTVNAAEKDRLLALATLRIAPLQDAVDLDDATAAEVVLLKKWKQYRVAVNRVDPTAENLKWPVPPAS